MEINYTQGTLMDHGLELPEEYEYRPRIGAELADKYHVETGKMWKCGGHKIICGDCLDPNIVTAVMHNHSAELIITDPPWNVHYGVNMLADQRSGKDHMTMDNDDLDKDYPDFCNGYCDVFHGNIQPGGSAYVFMSSKEWPLIDSTLRGHGFHWASTIIWAKDCPSVPNRKEYFPMYEPIWYGWDDRKGHIRPIKTSANDLWPVPRPRINVEHPTQKPVFLAFKAMRNSSLPGDIVFDPFGGIGFVLIAAEKLQRKARIIEINPNFVGVMLQRYVDLTGNQPIEISTNSYTISIKE